MSTGDCAKNEMKYQEYINWLEDVPLYGHKDGVNNIRKLMDRMGNPQEKYRIIHVAGTNGKGSCCAMLSSVLSECGLCVGLFTSPHLIDYTERIQVDRRPIARRDFVRIGQKVRREIEQMVREGENHCTFFEILTAMGFLYFAEQKVDVVVLETGVGGRLDATNIVEAPQLLLTLITSISLDHTKVLGDTVSLIAGEKAGIMRRNVPVVLSKNPAEVQQVVQERARALGCQYIYAGEVEPSELMRRGEDGKLHPIPLEGLYQRENVSAVLAALAILKKQRRKGHLTITDDAIDRGLLKTVWPGRMQEKKLYGKKILLDGAHNPAGANHLAEYLKVTYPSECATLVFSALGKKDVSGILRVLRDCPAVGSAVFTRIHEEKNEDRFLEIWQEEGQEKVKSFTIIPEPIEAVRYAAREKKGSLVVCAGSLYLIGEILDKLGKRG